jgi:transglutaminase/protease-like cytokinesis protein 3
MRSIFQIVFLFFIQFSMAQIPNEFSAIDAKMVQIPADKTNSTSDISDYINANFTSESDKIRAAFFWTASNISYDVVNMNEPNFIYSPQEKIANALKNRKGVCIHYAEVFNEIANKLGIKTYIIGGYTKQNGKVALISHAWCGSKIDGKWLLFDPTWASGYVNGEKFVKKFNNSYYKAAPSKMIQSHMPFDYMWQFLNDPYTNSEFYEGKLSEERLISNYDFATEISKYEKLPEDEKAFEASQRIEKNKVINELIAGYLANKKQEFTVLRQNKSVDKLNQIVADFNQAVADLNNFIYYRNNKFKPKLPDEEIKSMIENPLGRLKQCQNDIYKIGSVGKENLASISGLKKSISETIKQAEEHDAFVKEYLTKSESQRKSMFKKSVLSGKTLR